MNKKVYNTILLFTGFVLIGIIALQIVWLNNMMSVRTRELKSNTRQALTETVKKLEKGEEIGFVMDHMAAMLPDSLDMERFGKVKVTLSADDSIETINISNNSMQGTMIHDPKNDGSKNHELITHRMVTISSNKLESKAKNVDSVVQQLLVELDSKTLGERIQADSVRNLLASELQNYGIDVEFEYAIFQDDSVIYKSEHYIPSSIAMTFDTKLFPNDIIDKNLKLIIYYPIAATNGYLFAKMRTTLLLTGLFTLGILIAFYLTIRTIKKQKKLGEMKNDFINNITHEFKTPIATSSIAIAALGNNQVRTDNEKFDYYTNILKEENLKMNFQVEKVLQMAMMEKGKVEIFLQEVNTHDILLQSIKGFELIFKEKRVEAEVSLNAERFTVKADAFHLLHAFNNIIDNAVKYKTEKCHIKIQTETKQNHLLVRFIDNGTGMSTEVQKNAFEKFYRGQKGNVHDVKGFGLGLSYAKNIVELCKGTIHLHSATGKGTELTISIPLV